MKIGQIVEHINTIERDIPVQEWRIDGVDIWPTVRINLFFSLFEYVTFSKPSVVSRSKRLQQIWDFVWRLLTFEILAIRDLVKRNKSCRFKFNKSGALFLDDLSYILMKDKKYQRFCDPVIDELKQKEISSYVLTVQEKREGVLTTPSFYIWGGLQRKRIWGLIKRKIFRNKKHDVNLPGLDQYNAYASKLGNGARELTVERLIRDCSIFLSMVEYYRKILEKISPRCAFVVCYYDPEHMAFIHACRQIDVPVVDLQHGVINGLHAAYGQWHNIPQDGYNTLPQYFACWDQDAADCINAWGASTSETTHEGVVFGNKFLEVVSRNAPSELSGFSDIFAKFQETPAISKNVLLSVQNKYLITNILKEILSNAPKSILWWIRIHPMATPVEKAKIYADLQEIEGLLYEEKEATAQNLYSILPFMDAHVTLNSSVVLEALEFGVTSVICESTGHEYYKDLIESGNARAAHTADEAISHIFEIERVDRMPTQVSSQRLYKKVGLI